MASFAEQTNVLGATCLVCGQNLAPDWLNQHYTCPNHQGSQADEGILDLNYAYDQAAARFPDPGQPGMWRFRALLPLPHDAVVSPLLVGQTPLLRADRLASQLGVQRLFIKDETRQPSGSLKDRASALAGAVAAWQGKQVIAAASTGNAAAALAGICASSGQDCVIFVPQQAPPGKVAQLLAYGAKVFLVRGTYTDAFDLCQAACKRYGWYNRNTGYNPLLAEGKKTVAFEIAEQLDWQAPDAVFVAVGDGCILAGVHKGFADLLRLGRIAKMPRLFGVQAKGSDFMVQAYEERRFSPGSLLAKQAIKASTRADSISADLPRDRLKAMRAVQDSLGAFLRVEDAEILAAVPKLAGLSGVFAEPSGAAPLAGLEQALANKLLDRDAFVCLLATGSGLKDPAALQAGGLPSPTLIEPDLADLAQWLEK